MKKMTKLALVLLFLTNCTFCDMIKDKMTAIDNKLLTTKLDDDTYQELISEKQRLQEQLNQCAE